MTDKATLLALAERVEKVYPQPNDAPWQEHDGGGRPHPPTSYVEVEIRSGVRGSCESAMLMWPWSNATEASDIIRWRFAPRPLSRVQAGRLLIENATTIAAALRARAETLP